MSVGEGEERCSVWGKGVFLFHFGQYEWARCGLEEAIAQIGANRTCIIKHFDPGTHVLFVFLDDRYMSSLIPQDQAGDG